MTEDEVQSVYNQPPSMSVASDGVVRKLYGSNAFTGWTYVDFQDGKSIGWGISAPGLESQTQSLESQTQSDKIEATVDSTIRVVD
jgi:hypothetical protein